MKKTNSFCAVILAGGSGTRFWPASREKKPKQFLKLLDDETLLAKTVKRVRPLIPPSDIYIVANRRFGKDIRAAARRFHIPLRNILLEPSGKNTAPAVLWAALKIRKKNKDAVMAVLPADHLVRKERIFLKHLKTAYGLAQKDLFVTLGILPTRPETGYGYIRVKKGPKRTFYKTVRFTEKPSLAKARVYLRSGQYYWNSGMFVWKADTLLEGFRRWHPPLGRFLKHPLPDFSDGKIWKRLPSISVDYALLEKADNVVTIPADIGWSDLGSWESLAEVLPEDQRGNILSKKSILKDCRNTAVFGEKLIVGIGLEDLVVVDTGDALLVCKKDDSQNVRDIVEILKKKSPGHL